MANSDQETSLERDNPANSTTVVARAMMAAGAGIKQVRTVQEESEIAGAAEMVKGGNATFFVHLKVNDGPPASIKRSLDANYTKTAFRKALLGEA